MAGCRPALLRAALLTLSFSDRVAHLLTGGAAAQRGACQRHQILVVHGCVRGGLGRSGVHVEPYVHAVLFGVVVVLFA